uniref:HAP2-GCS1 domain-containing protein n=1 Tax=Globodera pallida TaxID=36090 RepID=A0A183BUX6_GLOPA
MASTNNLRSFASIKALHFPSAHLPPISSTEQLPAACRWSPLIFFKLRAPENEVQVAGNFPCAKTGVTLPGGLTIPMDKQIRIDPNQLLNKEVRLLKNAKEERIVFTVVAEASCQKYFNDVKLSMPAENFMDKKCVLSNAGAVDSKHQTSDCKNCKAFTLSCPCIMAKAVDDPDAHVFKINLNKFKVITQCKWRAYIDDARVLLDNADDTNGEACFDEGLGTMLIALIAGGAGLVLIIIVAAVVAWLMSRRKQEIKPGGVNVPQSAWTMAGGSKAQTNGTYTPKSTWSTFGLGIGSSKTKGAVGRSKAESSGVAVPNTIWAKTKGASTTANATANITKAKASGVTTAGKKTFMSGASATAAVGRTKADKSGVAVPNTLMTGLKGGATTAANTKGPTTFMPDASKTAGKKTTGAYGVL